MTLLLYRLLGTVPHQLCFFQVQLTLDTIMDQANANRYILTPFLICLLMDPRITPLPPPTDP